MVPEQLNWQALQNSSYFCWLGPLLKGFPSLLFFFFFHISVSVQTVALQNFCSRPCKKVEHATVL